MNSWAMGMEFESGDLWFWEGPGGEDPEPHACVHRPLNGRIVKVLDLRSSSRCGGRIRIQQKNEWTIYRNSMTSMSS
jgi:hypothetical protein